MTKGIVITLSLFSLIFGIPRYVGAIKPRPPVELTLLSAALSEEETKITLTARANIKTSKISMIIDLPLGLTLVEGEPHWEGPLKRGETQQMTIIIQGAGGIADEILGSATIHLPNKGTFVQKTRLVLNALNEKPPLPLPPIRQKGGTGSVLEFRGKS